MWFPLTLLCAFSLATADAFTKRYLSDYTDQELVIIRFSFTGLVLAPLLLFHPLPPLPAICWGWLAMLVPLEILAMLLYMRAIRDSPLSLTLPYLAFTPVLTILTSFVILREQISVQGFCGILLVVAGAYFLNLEHLQGNHWLLPFRAILWERGSRLMLVVATIYSITSVLGKIVLQYIPAAAFGPFYFALLGCITLALFSLKQPSIGRVLWRQPGQHLMIGLLLGTMVVTHFMAIAQVEVAYMISVKRTSLLFGILYGALLFEERRLGQRLLAGGLMVAGIALIALG